MRTYPCPTVCICLHALGIASYFFEHFRTILTQLTRKRPRNSAMIVLNKHAGELFLIYSSSSAAIGKPNGMPQSNGLKSHSESWCWAPNMSLRLGCWNLINLSSYRVGDGSADDENVKRWAPDPLRTLCQISLSRRGAYFCSCRDAKGFATETLQKGRFQECYWTNNEFYGDLEQGFCTEISETLHGNLFWGPCAKILPRDLLHKSCTEMIAKRPHIENFYKDLV